MRRTLVTLALAASLASTPNLADLVRGALFALWGEYGCSIDPWGYCTQEDPSTAPESDYGCRIDPWGCPQTGS